MSITRLSFQLCLLLVVLAGTARADPVVITFDESAPGTYLSNFYESLGIRFASNTSPDGETPLVNTGRFQIQTSASAVSPLNVAAPAPPSGDSTFTDISGRFVNFGSRPWTTSVLSLYVVGTEPGQSVPWIFNIYNSSDQLLESRQGTTDMLLNFLQPDIGRFVLFGSGGGEMIDNVAFTPDPVPEPATVIMIGTGLALGLRAARRRQRATTVN